MPADPADLAGIAFAFLLYVPILVAPGLALGWAGDILGFRTARAPARLLIGILTSAAVVPIGAYLSGRFLGFAATWTLVGAAWTAVLLGPGNMVSSAALRATGKALTLPWAATTIAVWTGAATLVLLDLRIGDGLLMNGTTIDRYSHVATISAIGRTGLPPANPFFHPGEAVPLAYHYLWFLLGSLVDRLGGPAADARHAALAGTLWSGLVLMAVVLLWTRRLAAAGLVPRAYGTAMLLLAVSGLDILAVAAVAALRTQVGRHAGIWADMEWWNDQVTAWADAVLWVPHHVTAAAVCLFGFLVLRHAADGASRRWPAIATAGAAFASAAGMSVWVTLVAALAFGLWLAGLHIAGRRHEANPGLFAGLLSFALAAPLLADLANAAQWSGPAVRFALRRFGPLNEAERWFGFDFACGAGCQLLTLPLNYAIEFGFILAGTALYYWAWRGRGVAWSDDEKFLALLAAVSLTVCTFVRSSLENNDLGWRGMMFAQVVFLLASLPAARGVLRPAEAGAMRLGRWPRMGLLAALEIGLATTAGDLLVMRFFEPSPANLSLRAAYQWIDRTQPPLTVIQHNPDHPMELVGGMYAMRQMGVGDQVVGRLHGVAPAAYERARNELVALFAAGASPAEAAAVAHRYRIDLLLVMGRDPAWSDGNGWANQVPPVYANAHSRVIAVADLEQAAAPR